MEQNYKAVKGIINGDFTPSKIAAKIADTNLALHEVAWEKTKEYWKEFKAFAKDLKNNLEKEIKNFPCLPLETQSEYICRGVSEVFLLVMGPGAFLKGAKWGVDGAKAMYNFMQSSKLLNGTEKMTAAQRLNAAAEAMRIKAAASKVREVLKLRNAKVVEVTLPDGEKILQYHSKMKRPDGKMEDVVREVPLDAKTRSIDANSIIGKQIMTELAANKAGSGTLLFIDINHLGKVNYFKGGTQSGDMYLEQAAESIRKSLRPDDLVFKNGGDELVVVIANNNPKVIKNISQRMINEVDMNPQVRQLFKQEVKNLSNKYNQLKNANSYDDLTPEIRQSFSVQERLLAQSDFKKFQDNAKKVLQQEIKDQVTYKGSISVGAALLKHDETVGSALARAERQAAQVKASYRASRGHDISKYNVEDGDLLFKPDYKGPPIALDPK